MSTDNAGTKTSVIKVQDFPKGAGIRGEDPQIVIALSGNDISKTDPESSEQHPDSSGALTERQRDTLNFGQFSISTLLPHKFFQIL